MDDDIRAHLEAMEGRLMTRINDNQERLVERLDGIEKQLDDVDLALTALTELAHETHTLLLGLSHCITNLEKNDDQF